MDGEDTGENEGKGCDTFVLYEVRFGGLEAAKADGERPQAMPAKPLNAGDRAELLADLGALDLRFEWETLAQRYRRLAGGGKLEMQARQACEWLASQAAAGRACDAPGAIGASRIFEIQT